MRKTWDIWRLWGPYLPNEQAWNAKHSPSAWATKATFLKIAMIIITKASGSRKRYWRIYTPASDISSTFVSNTRPPWITSARIWCTYKTDMWFRLILPFGGNDILSNWVHTSSKWKTRSSSQTFSNALSSDSTNTCSKVRLKSHWLSKDVLMTHLDQV